MTTAAKARAYSGPAIFSYGFRPFFWGGAVWAGAAMALFFLILQGDLVLPTTFDVVDWHIHELLYGYLPAIVAGFLLTAVPNWTGRLPVTGAPLAALFAIWLAGRVAVATSALTGPVFTAAADLSFLIAIGAVAGREIAAGKNYRNLIVLALVTLLGAGNLVFHIEAATSGSSDYGKRIGIAAAILLISLIGGRVVPSFTRNWLARSGPDNLPAPPGRFDVGVIAISAIALFIWVAVPASVATAAACALAGALQFIRLARWKGHRTFSEPLVTVLHAGLHLCAHRLCADSNCIRIARYRGAGGRHPRLDRWRNRLDDARDHDPRQPRPHGPAAYRFALDRGNLSLCRSGGSHENRGLVGRGAADYALRRRGMLDFGVLGLLCRVRAATPAIPEVR